MNKPLIIEAQFLSCEPEAFTTADLAKGKSAAAARRLAGQSIDGPGRDGGTLRRQQPPTLARPTIASNEQGSLSMTSPMLPPIPKRAAFPREAAGASANDAGLCSR